MSKEKIATALRKLVAEIYRDATEGRPYQGEFEREVQAVADVIVESVKSELDKQRGR